MPNLFLTLSSHHVTPVPLAVGVVMGVALTVAGLLMAISVIGILVWVRAMAQQGGQAARWRFSAYMPRSATARSSSSVAPSDG
jgi:hypothetical protein